MPATAVGGGRGLLAPWPAGITFQVGKPCGSYYRQAYHRDYGGRWGDDSWALDIGICGAGDKGTPILAAHDGVVRLSYYNGAYGNNVLIEESSCGLATRYAHLNGLSVKAGQRVRAGQRIGTLGHTGTAGAASNSHLHFVAYGNCRARSGFAPSPMAGVNLCNGCMVRSQTGAPRAPDVPPFSASLDAQFPVDRDGKVYVKAGGPAVTIGYNARFNQRFNVGAFVLRPDTPENIGRFASVKGDWPGATAPNDDRVGYYRASIQAPANTPTGTYFMRWNAIHTGTGQLGNLQPSFHLVVLPADAPDGQPCPPPAPGGPFTLSSDPSFKATNDGQFPMDAGGFVHVTQGDTVAFGYNVRFNQAFNATNFALRTDTPGTINYFSSVPGDWRGQVAPNDSHVGYYRASLTVPACTPTGDYPLRWNVINMATGKWGGLQPSLVLRVHPRG